MAEGSIADVPAQEIGEFVQSHMADLDLEHKNFTLSEMSQTLTAIKLAAKVINREISKTNRFSLDTYEDDGVISNATICNLANIKFVDALRNRKTVAGIATSDAEKFISCQTDKHLVVVIHPLDGNKSIDVNVSLGSIFSIYQRISPTGQPCQEVDFLQAGNQQVAAGYLIYGTSTMMVCTLGNGTFGFTVDPSIGTFYLSHANMTMPHDGKIFSINGDDRRLFVKGVQDYIDYCRENVLTCRYIGSLVADFHRNILKGGIYIAPPTVENTNHDIATLFQAFPLAFLAEQASGDATDGYKRILDKTPQHLHEKTAFICGSKNMAEKFSKFVQ